MSLKITTEPMENRQLALTIEVDQARVDQQLRKAARKLGRQYRIPGFRKGKAPYKIVVQYVGAQTLYSEFVDDLSKEVYIEALEQEAFKPYANATLQEMSVDPLTYHLVVPLAPTVDLGDYRSLRVEEKPGEIDEEKVTQRLNAYQEKYTGWEAVDRPSEYGDVMTIDVKSVIAPDEEGGEEIIVLDETDWDVTPDKENPMEPDGFDEALIGMMTGNEKEFDLSWPEEGQSIYAGKTAHYVVAVHDVKAFQKPELDDDFAQMVGPDYETLDDLLKDIRESLLEEAETEAKNAYVEKALKAVFEIAEIDYPQVVVEDQIDVMIKEEEQRLRQYGVKSLASYLEQRGEDKDEHREKLRAGAVQLAERKLLLSELMRAEKIIATDVELDAKIEEFIGNPDDNEGGRASADALADVFHSDSGRAMIESQVIYQKTVDRLLAIVRGEEIPEPDEEADLEEETAVEEETEAGTEAEVDVEKESDDETEVAAESEADAGDEGEAEPEIELETGSKDK